jgi:hypothetical protein
MLALFGRDPVIRNLYRLAMLERNGVEADGLDDLAAIRQGYLDFLDQRQRGVASNRHDDYFNIDPAVEETLSAAFRVGELNDLNQADIVGDGYADREARGKQELARQALCELMALDDDFALVFALAIHSVFIRPSRPGPGRPGSYGGSSSASIGAIWLTVDDRVSLLDLQEMFVHELTHHLLFIDELNQPQFAYLEISKPENFARSAILRRQRPLDKVVHSIVVACEVLLARQRFLPHGPRTVIHPPSGDLARETLAAIASVDALPNRTMLMTPHLLDIIETCRVECHRQLEALNACLEPGT